MPTFNQLVRKGRKVSTKKSNSSTSVHLQLSEQEDGSTELPSEERCLYRCSYCYT